MGTYRSAIVTSWQVSGGPSSHFSSGEEMVDKQNEEMDP